MRKFRLNASEAFLCASSYDYYYIHGIFCHLHFIRFWWRTKWHYGRWDDIKEKQQIPEPESYLVHRAEKKTIVLAAHLPISSFCQKNEQFRRILSNGRRKSVKKKNGVLQAQCLNDCAMLKIENGNRCAHCTPSTYDAAQCCRVTLLVSSHCDFKRFCF